MKLDGLRYRRCEDCNWHAYMRPTESKCSDCRDDSNETSVDEFTKASNL